MTGGSEREGGEGTGTGVPAPRPAELPARRFSDEEVARILRAASELQERSPGGRVGAGGGGTGLTLEDLRQVAAEVGIDPHFVELAAERVYAPAEREESALGGGAYAWNLHRTIPGEVREEDRDRIVRAIRAVIGQKGEVEDVYGRMEWSYDDGLGPIMVGLSSRDGRTEIDVSARRGGEMGIAYGLGVPFGGMAGGAVVGGAILGLTGPVMLVPIAAAGLAIGAGLRFSWRWVSGHWEKKLGRLADAVEAAAAEVAVFPQDEVGRLEGPAPGKEGRVG